MVKVLRISLISVTILLSFGSLCFGTQLEKGILSTNSPNEPIYSLWPLTQKKESTFSLFEKADCENAFYAGKLINTTENKEIPINLEVANSMKPLPIPDIQEKYLIHFESGEPANDKSRYHFQETHLTKTNFDSFLKTILSFLENQYKKGNPLYRDLEAFNGIYIVKPCRILLGLKMDF